jgi:soluble lytic murein transglycosylase
MLPVLRHAVEAVEAEEGERVDWVCLLQPTAPFRTAGDVRAAFAGRAPETGAGAAALARVRLAAGDQDGAREMARRAWVDTSLTAEEEAAIIRDLGSLLTAADHKVRLDHLLIHDARWAASRTHRAVVARRLIPLLPESERKVAQARLAVFLREKKSSARLPDVPRGPEVDWGLVFHKAQAARRADRHKEARTLLLSAPTDVARAVSPDAWWAERRASAYAALEQGDAKAAYALVREGGALSANPRKEQTFLAGWISLRYLNQPKAAAGHFADMVKAVDGPLSTAKARYWSGRAAETLGDSAAARQHYAAASRFPDTFHGQLSIAKIATGRAAFAFAPPALPTSAQAKAFGDDLAVRAAVVAHKAGLVGPARAFLFHLVRAAGTTEAQAAMLAHLAQSLGDTQAAVRTAKAAIASGHNLALYAYPTHPMPSYKPLRDPPEAAFLLAIARQESEFNTSIVSGAGARGLLQVMPITARHVCSDYKIRCDIPRLLKDEAYNASIASAYIGDRMAEFGGSYVLTLAGYNAGPGRARQWMRQFGDPRDPNVDPIDWIERIPFEETREYVAKVLSNIQVYRARLGDGAGGLRVMDDLARGRSGPKPVRAAGPQ